MYVSPILTNAFSTLKEIHQAEGNDFWWNDFHCIRQLKMFTFSTHLQWWSIRRCIQQILNLTSKPVSNERIRELIYHFPSKRKNQNSFSSLYVNAASLEIQKFTFFQVTYSSSMGALNIISHDLKIRLNIYNRTTFKQKASC